MKYHLYLDESGDHGLSFIDPKFPIFLLCRVLISDIEFTFFHTRAKTIKMIFWNTSDIIFHSRDIRKCSKEFKILLDLELKSKFHKELNLLIKESTFSIIPSGIHKQHHIEKYGLLSSDPYELCLSNIIDNTVRIINGIADTPNQLKIIIEKRGKKEDNQLASHLNKIMANGTNKISRSLIQKFEIEYSFKSKKEKNNGLQLADLIAYPIAKYALNNERENLAFEIIEEKIHQSLSKILLK